MAKDTDPKTLVFNLGDDYPIYWVRWDETVAFCRKLTKQEGSAGRLPAGDEYRLPTEAEWEYARRAGTTEATYAGKMEIKGRNNAPALDAIAWSAGNSSVGYTGHGLSSANWKKCSLPAATPDREKWGDKQPNAWGLYDLLAT